MPLTVPPAKNYSSPLISVPSRVDQVPPEGKRTVPVEVLWTTMMSAGQSISFNLQDMTTNPLSQIMGLSVDNSKCGVSVRFIFPDTGETVTFPAGSPKTIIEVFTNQKQFYIEAIGEVVSTDVTRFSILNFVPLPIAVPAALEQSVAAVTGIDATVAGVTQVVPVTESGLLEILAVAGMFGANTGDIGTWEIRDGNSKLIATNQNVSESAGNNIPPLVIPGMHVPFQGGLTFEVITTTLPSDSFYAVNLYYRQYE